MQKYQTSNQKFLYQQQRAMMKQKGAYIFRLICTKLTCTTQGNQTACERLSTLNPKRSRVELSYSHMFVYVHWF